MKSFSMMRMTIDKYNSRIKWSLTTFSCLLFFYTSFSCFSFFSFSYILLSILSSLFSRLPFLYLQHSITLRGSFACIDLSCLALSCPSYSIPFYYVLYHLFFFVYMIKKISKWVKQFILFFHISVPSPV